MASSDRIDELKRKFDENPRRYFAPLANEFRKGGDLDQAILICQEFLPQQPGHMSGHIVYGQALYESGRLDEARGVFETALSLDPENLIALRHLGDIAGRQGDPTSARRWYERVLEADPRNEEIQSLVAGLGDAPAQESTAPAPVSAPAESSFEVAPPVREATPAHVPPPPFAEPELLDLDVTMPDVSAAPVAATSPSDPYERSDVEQTAHGDIEPMPETADLMPATDARAEGFESTEFSAPEAPVEPTTGLETAWEIETGVHVAFVPPVQGLDRPETTVDAPPPLAITSAFPELEEALPEDRGDVLPPHGDPIVESEPQPPTSSRDDSLLDFDMPVVHESVREAEAVSAEAARPSDAEGANADAALPTIPSELPPEVIAAEAELTDAGASTDARASEVEAEQPLDTESVGSELSYIDVGDSSEAPTSSEVPSEPAEAEVAEAPVAEESAAEPAEHRPFVTETMAELYLKQGFRQEALSVYERLSAGAPDDARLSSKVASLRAELAAPVRKPSGPPVRDFFARIATRRPGERALAAAPPSENDFGAPPDETAPSPSSPDDAPASEAPPPAQAAPSDAPRAAATIDALFGHRPASSVEDSAASALAQAFGGTTDAPAITGNPTRPAAGELTLDSVFRDGGSRGPRTSQGFSFDQFFSQSVEGDRTSGGDRPSQEVSAPGEPAERSEDDIEQFNSWLQGLKQR